jgi:GntR family transcriptional regulator, transcriptional repressor for pyruvate dehydrogenase complex
VGTRNEQVWSTTVDHLRALIDSGELPAGSRLPAERKLCEQLDVSRGSLRQALRVLDSIGYVAIRPGSGTYVREQAGAELPLRSWFREHDQLVDRLFELRRTVEPTLAERLAGRAAEAVLGRLRANVAEMAAAAEAGDMLRVIATDAEFHRVIAENAGNDDVAALLRSVLSLVGEERRAALRLPGQIAKAVEEHRGILAAISRGDGVRARELTVRHLQEAQDLVHHYTGTEPSTSDKPQ